MTLPAIPINRPQLPTAEQLLPYLREIDKARYYTNYGVLHERLHRRLCAHLRVAENQLALASSGTSALIGLILAQTGRACPERPLCICPSYTFAATAAAAGACGYTPYFADIRSSDWMLDPARLLSLPEFHRAGLVLLVAPYGHMPALGAWEDFSTRTGLPVVIDAAACFDSIDAPALCRGRVSAAVSLHATKTLSTAEGGVMLSGDPELVARAARALNFGFFNSRESVGPSINGKISEYHAAIGLADLDGWETKRAGFMTVAAAYAAEAQNLGLAQQVVTHAHANPYVLFNAATALQADAVTCALDAHNIGYRRWYGQGLHVQPAFRECPAEALPVTSAIAQRLIGLPMAVDLQPREIGRVMNTIALAVG